MNSQLCEDVVSRRAMSLSCEPCVRIAPQGVPRLREEGRVRERVQGRERYRRSVSAFTLTELLIALTITALLLTATSVAFDAALTSYQSNQQMSLAGLAVRNVLNQMSTTMRSAWNDPAYDTIDVSNGGTQCSLVDSEGRVIIYRYVADSHQLEMNIDGADTWHVLLDGVWPCTANDMIFTAHEPTDSHFEDGTVGCIDIRFVVQREDISQPVAASIVPRNILYRN